MLYNFTKVSLYDKLNEVGNEIMSSIRINYLSYRVVPVMKNGATCTIENTPFRVQPISAVNATSGYNFNNPNNGENFPKVNHKNNSSFENILQEEIAKLNGSGRKR